MKRFALLFALLIAAAAHAADYPTRPIKIVVPYTPGGAVDVMTRLLAEKVSASIGQPVVAENRPGAGASVGSAVVAKSPPDGYTILVCTNGAMTINTALYKSLGYEPLRDFEPIIQLANHAVVLIVNSDLGIRSVPELLAFARSRPGKVSGGSSGSGSTMHLALEFLNKTAGTSITHVPYRGSAPATAAVASGDLHMSFMDLVPALPLAKAGKVRIIGVIGQRTAIAPEVPTMEEGGLKGFDFVTWSGYFAPAGTPKDVIAKLTAAVQESLKSPAVIERARTTGMAIRFMPPAELDATVKSDLQYWSKVIRDARISAD